jgi:hypothetical protein
MTHFSSLVFSFGFVLQTNLNALEVVYSILVYSYAPIRLRWFITLFSVLFLHVDLDPFEVVYYFTFFCFIPTRWSFIFVCRFASVLCYLSRCLKRTRCWAVNYSSLLSLHIHSSVSCKSLVALYRKIHVVSDFVSFLDCFFLWHAYCL